MNVNFGVFNIPYADNPRKNAGSVALELEKEYGIFVNFYLTLGVDIREALTPGIVHYLKSKLDYGGDMTGFLPGNADVIRMFHRFLQMKMMDGLPGVPTWASLHDTRDKYAGEDLGGARPSFVDTGLFMASMVVWEDY